VVGVLGLLNALLYLCGAAYHGWVVFHTPSLQHQIEDWTRTTFTREIAPVTIRSVHCSLNDDDGECDFSTSDHHRYRVHVIIYQDDSWKADRVSAVS